MQCVENVFSILHSVSAFSVLRISIQMFRMSIFCILTNQGGPLTSSQPSVTFKWCPHKFTPHETGTPKWMVECKDSGRDKDFFWTGTCWRHFSGASSAIPLPTPPSKSSTSGASSVFHFRSLLGNSNPVATNSKHTQKERDGQKQEALGDVKNIKLTVKNEAHLIDLLVKSNGV